MTFGKQNISFEIVRLLIGHFTSTNTEAQKEALDEWIGMNEGNMKIFEQCMEKSLRSVRPDPYKDELAYFVNLAWKHVTNTINLVEKEILEEWINESSINKKLLIEMPVLNDMEVLYNWQLKKLEQEDNKRRMN